MTASVAVIWFRRDLRVHDHPALVKAVAGFDRIAPLFVVDERLVGRGEVDGPRPPAVGASPNRTWFMGRSVATLARTLADLGADLAILRGDPAALVPRFAAGIGARAVIVSRDYAPYGRRRDDAVARACATLGIGFSAEPGVLVHDPEEVRRADGGSFGLFAPYHRRWEACERRPVLPPPARIRGARPPRGAHRDIDAALGDVRPTADPDLVPEPGEAAARSRLAAWSRSAALAAYATGRDRLDVAGSSRLSQDVRWGLLSAAEILARCAADAGAGEGPARFRAEIAWRDFYAHLLWHRPELVRRSLRPEFDDLGWRGDGAIADAWRQGRTGVPIVDAAMRQLAATGWMPNRARMVAASYLVKQLGVDWRIGAAHLMAHLVDGDIASNCGNWQWVASTGTEAQPWFRIFDPVRQGRRFDPDGAYVRRWVPELAGRGDLAGAAVHEPPPGAYLPAIVDRTEARARALDAYRSARTRHSVGRPVADA